MTLKLSDEGKLTHGASYSRSCRNRPLHALRQPQCDEKLGRIEVVFSGLVNDSDQTVLFGGRIGNHRVKFPYFQISSDAGYPLLRTQRTNLRRLLIEAGFDLELFLADAMGFIPM
jgi:hypothetical protein